MDYLNEKTYVDQAEQVLKKLTTPYQNKLGETEKYPLVTTTKIRNILSMAADIYDKTLQNPDSNLNDDIVSRIEYLRIRVIYECGRSNNRKRKGDVTVLVENAKILEYLKMINGDKSRYILFYRYLEALVAFHRFYGGEDN